MDKDKSQNSEIHEARVSCTSEKFMVLSLFSTTIPPVFWGPKYGRDSSNLFYGLKTTAPWDTQKPITVLMARIRYP